MLIFSITTCTPTRTFSGATKIRGQTVYTVHVSSSPKSRQWIAVIAADLLGTEGSSHAGTRWRCKRGHGLTRGDSGDQLPQQPCRCVPGPHLLAQFVCGLCVQYLNFSSKRVGSSESRGSFTYTDADGVSNSSSEDSDIPFVTTH